MNKPSAFERDSDMALANHRRACEGSCESPEDLQAKVAEWRRDHAAELIQCKIPKTGLITKTACMRYREAHRLGASDQMLSLYSQTCKKCFHGKGQDFSSLKKKQLGSRRSASCVKRKLTDQLSITDVAKRLKTSTWAIVACCQNGTLKATETSALRATAKARYSVSRHDFEVFKEKAWPKVQETYRLSNAMSRKNRAKYE